MSQHVEGNYKSFLNGGSNIARALRVKKSSGVLALAGLTDAELGTTREFTKANEHGAVQLRTAAGTCLMTASKQIAVDTKVYTAANGKISDVQGVGAFLIGVTLDAASGDGSIIEVLRNAHGDDAGT